jgi:hypothetical protein
MIKLARKYYLTTSLEAIENRKMNRLEDARDMPLLSFIVIFNSIVAPYIANMAVSQSCFRNLLSQAHDVTSAFPFQSCAPIENQNIREYICPSDVSVLLPTSYSPPFIYYYECSSAFVKNYAGLYVYLFTIDAFFQPLFQICLKCVYDCYILVKTNNIVYNINYINKQIY